MDKFINTTKFVVGNNWFVKKTGAGPFQFFSYQNIDYNIQTNNLQSTKINQNNMIKMSQTINITLQPMQ